MELKTSSGVEIRVKHNTQNDTIILSFDRPVRTLGLKAREATKVGSNLLSVRNEGITDDIRNLSREGFFEKKRSLNEVEMKLKKTGTKCGKSSVSSILKRMTDTGELAREKVGGNYKYYSPLQFKN